MWQAKTKLDRLTPEQEALLPVYREKWRGLATSTEPIDRSQATATIQGAYRAANEAMGQNELGIELFGINPEPEILFFSSPQAARLELLARSPQEVVQQLGAPTMGLTSLAFQSYQYAEELDGEFHAQLVEKLFQNSSVEQLLSLVEQHLARQLSGEERQKCEQIQEQLQQQMPLKRAWERSQEQWREQLQQKPGGEWLLQLGDSFWQQVAEPFWTNVGQPAAEQIAKISPVQEQIRIFKQIAPGLKQIFWIDFGLGYLTMQPGMNTSMGSVADFCISVLNCPSDREKWSIVQSLASECGWYAPFSQTCLVCDRPTQLSFDSDNLLHGEAEPALQFADGYSIYARHGVVLPDEPVE